jgi:hypothetical protein
LSIPNKPWGVKDGVLSGETPSYDEKIYKYL